MKGIRFHGPANATFEEVEEDASPLGREEVAGRTVATLVSSGTELALYGMERFRRVTGHAAVF
ncbi:MAG TPA: hypothetical protein VNT60_03865, partial [Deinococcales bacterium]|nr:hypothetical protein [Deinococcales bacterium]